MDTSFKKMWQLDALSIFMKFAKVQTHILGPFGNVSDSGIFSEDFQEQSQNCFIVTIFSPKTPQAFVHKVTKFQASSMFGSRNNVNCPQWVIKNWQVFTYFSVNLYGSQNRDWWSNLHKMYFCINPNHCLFIRYHLLSDNLAKLSQLNFLKRKQTLADFCKNKRA